MNIKIMFSIVMLTSFSLTNAQPWYAEHHKAQTIDQLATAITNHESISRQSNAERKAAVEHARRKLWLQKQHNAELWSIAAHNIAVALHLKQLEAEAAAREEVALLIAQKAAEEARAAALAQEETQRAAQENMQTTEADEDDDTPEQTTEESSSTATEAPADQEIAA